jgi:DNA-binding GntR family transcriptional regulator
MVASPEQREHAVSRAAKIFAIVRQAAERGEPCPTNHVLRQRFACSDGSVVRALDFLEANGMIRVERGRSSRVVTISATGQKTAGSVDKPHWSRREAA